MVAPVTSCCCKLLGAIPALGLSCQSLHQHTAYGLRRNLPPHSSLRCLIYKMGIGLGFGNQAVGPTLFRVTGSELTDLLTHL